MSNRASCRLIRFARPPIVPFGASRAFGFALKMLFCALVYL